MGAEWHELMDGYTYAGKGVIVDLDVKHGVVPGGVSAMPMNVVDKLGHGGSEEKSEEILDWIKTNEPERTFDFAVVGHTWRCRNFRKIFIT